METLNEFQGLVIKSNTDSDHVLDCELCCFHNKCKCDCPLTHGFYFDKPGNSRMSVSDRKRVQEVIVELSWITNHLKDLLSIHKVGRSTVSLAQTYLDSSLAELSNIVTFDN